MIAEPTFYNIEKTWMFPETIHLSYCVINEDKASNLVKVNKGEK